MSSKMASIVDYLLTALVFWIVCSVGCPAGLYESKPCTNFGDHKCSGEYPIFLHLSLS